MSVLNISSTVLKVLCIQLKRCTVISRVQAVLEFALWDEFAIAKHEPHCKHLHLCFSHLKRYEIERDEVNSVPGEFDSLIFETRGF